MVEIQEFRVPVKEEGWGRGVPSEIILSILLPTNRASQITSVVDSKFR